MSDCAVIVSHEQVVVATIQSCNNTVLVSDERLQPFVLEHGQQGPAGIIGADGKSALELGLGNATYSYDVSGNVTNKTWTNGNHTDYTYTSGDLTQIDYYVDDKHYRRTITWTAGTVTQNNLIEVI